MYIGILVHRADSTKGRTDIFSPDQGGVTLSVRVPYSECPFG